MRMNSPLPPDIVQVRITAGAGYFCAGTVEFLVDPKTWQYYFMEVNPRIQVEHTVTEVITGVDLVQTQIRVAAGQRLKEIGLSQDTISKRGYAADCAPSASNGGGDRDLRRLGEREAIREIAISVSWGNARQSGRSRSPSPIRIRADRLHQARHASLIAMDRH